MNIHALSMIQIHNRNNEVPADLRLRPQGHWDRPGFIYIYSHKFNIVLMRSNSLQWHDD
jgi:hypothetical protein